MGWEGEKVGRGEGENGEWGMGNGRALRATTKPAARSAALRRHGAVGLALRLDFVGRRKASRPAEKSTAPIADRRFVMLPVSWSRVAQYHSPFPILHSTFYIFHFTCLPIPCLFGKIATKTIGILCPRTASAVHHGGGYGYGQKARKPCTEDLPYGQSRTSPHYAAGRCLPPTIRQAGKRSCSPNEQR